jgi:hypothetical protein
MIKVLKKRSTLISINEAGDQVHSKLASGSPMLLAMRASSDDTARGSCTDGDARRSAPSIATCLASVRYAEVAVRVENGALRVGIRSTFIHGSHAAKKIVPRGAGVSLSGLALLAEATLPSPTTFATVYAFLVPPKQRCLRPPAQGKAAKSSLAVLASL